MRPFRDRRLDLAMIEVSTQIQDWLEQFSRRDRDIAMALLLRLRFVPRDTFSEWVRKTISDIGSNSMAIYSVRKMRKDVDSLWDPSGQIIDRPGRAQGSEDLAYSIIRQLSRESGRFLDNPDLGTLKEKRVRDIILLDDSIGSGKRVADFISRMFENKTLMSWWSYGLVKIHVISYVRSREGTRNITTTIPGSDHPKRKHPKSKKVTFHSESVYSTQRLEPRWGSRSRDILDLCDKYTQIPKEYRRGYGGVMSSFVFYHSVPNNIPGILFWSSGKSSWNPLFPGRTLPDWLCSMLENPPKPLLASHHDESKRKLIQLMELIKRGVRRSNSLALRMGLDTYHVQGLIEQTLFLGFINEKLRPTKAGIDFLMKNSRVNDGREYDYSLYVPGSWCAGRRTVQPPSSGKADSAESMSADGEVGKASLARTDAMAASPPVRTTVASAPVSVVPHQPSEPRKGHDTHGPKGLKEK